MVAAVRPVAGAVEVAIEYVIDGGGSPIAPGIQWPPIEVPFDCVITAARLLADQVGSIVLDVWRGTYATYPPDNGDSITGATPPTIVADAKSEDIALVGWNRNLLDGDVLAFNVDSAANLTSVTVSLSVTRSPNA